MGLLDEAIREHLELKRLRGADPVDVARMERDALGPARRPDTAADALGDGEAALDAAEPGGQLLGDHETAAPAPHADEPAVGSAAWDEAEPELAPPAFEAPAPATTGADEGSIAPASYGQETAEFDVESAALDTPPAEPAAPPPVAGQPEAVPGPQAPDVSDHDPLAAPPASPDEPGPYGEPAAASVDAGAIPPADPAEYEADFEDDRTRIHPTNPAAAAPPAETHHPTPAPAHQPAADDEEAAEDVLEETPEFLQETPEHERLWFEQRPPRDFDFDK
jgi:hypothetical protein